MSYDYKAEREKLFTDAGQRVFLSVRDAAFRLLKKAGAFSMPAVIQEAEFGAADSFELLASVDRMIELGELCEVGAAEIQMARHVHRIFTWGAKLP
jgi:hypothetical protein